MGFAWNCGVEWDLYSFLWSELKILIRLLQHIRNKICFATRCRNSGWFVNSFVMVVWKNICSVVLCTQNFDWKKFSWENHYKTIQKTVRIDRSSHGIWQHMIGIWLPCPPLDEPLKHFVDQTNVALHKPVFLSSTAGSHPADLAVDGNDRINPRFCAKTTNSRSGPWLVVDLQADILVSSVTITNGGSVQLFETLFGEFRPRILHHNSTLFLVSAIHQTLVEESSLLFLVTRFICKKWHNLLCSAGADPELLLEGGANHQPGARNEYLNKNFRKTAWNWRNFGP